MVTTKIYKCKDTTGSYWEIILFDANNVVIQRKNAYSYRYALILKTQLLTY